MLSLSEPSTTSIQITKKVHEFSFIENFGTIAVIISSILGFYGSAESYTKSLCKKI